MLQMLSILDPPIEIRSHVLNKFNIKIIYFQINDGIVSNSDI